MRKLASLLATIGLLTTEMVISVQPAAAQASPWSIGCEGTPQGCAAAPPFGPGARPFLRVGASAARVTVYGADAVFGRFAGGDCNWGAINFANRQRDIDNLAATGVNLIRVSVAADDYYSQACGSRAQFLADLDTVINYAQNTKNLQIELSQASPDTSPNVTAFLTLLATRYASPTTYPGVIIKLANEPDAPDCAVSGPNCGNWTYWQSTEQAWLDAVRTAGFKNIVVVNCVYWSWDCSGLPAHALTDRGVPGFYNLVYGAHRYGNGALTWDQAQIDDANVSWANTSFTDDYVMIVDEVGLYDGVASPVAWGIGFLDWVCAWSKPSGGRNGSGLIGFVDNWSDANTMTNQSDGTWTAWGTALRQHYWPPTGCGY